jgi:hypothetical protein
MDVWWHKIEAEMTKTEGVPRSRDVTLSKCEIRDQKLYFRDRAYVPDNELRLLLIQSAHDSVEEGHPGKNSLYEVVSRYYWWPRLSQDIRRFTTNCHGCIRNKTSRLRYQGTLKPLPLPIQRWRDISVDFVGPTIEKNGFNCIMVVICRLSKERHYSACHTTMTANELAKIFVRDIWRLHGLPDSIVSDRGPLFESLYPNSGKQSATCYKSTSVFPQLITRRPTAKPRLRMHIWNSIYATTSTRHRTTSSSGYPWRNLPQTMQ